MGKSKSSKKKDMTSSTEGSAGYGVSITSITTENKWSESNPEPVDTK
ncbi:MAG: hypothetical protein RR539_05170 [Clostridium sp.]